MKHFFHLQSIFGLNPLQLFAWSTINYIVLFLFWGGAVQGADAVHLYCSLYCIYLGSKLWFLHIYLDYHTEEGQLIIIKQLCQKMFYLTFYIDCWINVISEVWRWSFLPNYWSLGVRYSVLRLYLKINKEIRINKNVIMQHPVNKDKVNPVRKREDHSSRRMNW